MYHHIGSLCIYYHHTYRVLWTVPTSRQLVHLPLLRQIYRKNIQSSLKDVWTSYLTTARPSMRAGAKRHDLYCFVYLLNLSPSFHRMTLLFFSLSGLDVLDSLDLTPSRKLEIIDWIYAQQVFPDPSDTGVLNPLEKKDGNKSDLHFLNSIIIHVHVHEVRKDAFLGTTLLCWSYKHACTLTTVTSIVKRVNYLWLLVCVHAIILEEGVCVQV